MLNGQFSLLINSIVFPHLKKPSLTAAQCNGDQISSFLHWLSRFSSKEFVFVTDEVILEHSVLLDLRMGLVLDLYELDDDLVRLPFPVHFPQSMLDSCF